MRVEFCEESNFEESPEETLQYIMFENDSSDEKDFKSFKGSKEKLISEILNILKTIESSNPLVRSDK